MPVMMAARLRRGGQKDGWMAGDCTPDDACARHHARQAGAGMRIDLLMVHGDHTHHVLSSGLTNADGRVDQPLLEGDRLPSSAPMN
jgi:hypothetical protein